MKKDTDNTNIDSLIAKWLSHLYFTESCGFNSSKGVIIRDLFCAHTFCQVKYRLLNERLQRLGRPQLTQPQLRPITQGESNNLEETITVTYMSSKEEFDK